jgi:type I restriction enzyme M protein
MALSTTIKTIQDIMRKDTGVDGDAQRIGQLVWMLFLKILDDREVEKETVKRRYRSPIPDDLRWGSWASNPEGLTGDALLAFVNGQLFPRLKGLPGADPLSGVVRSVFEDAYNYMKSGQLLRQVVNKLNEIDFNRSSDRHELGGVYEQILGDLRSAGNAGEYYTPRALTEFMVDRVNPELGETVLDPACGTGGFLVSAIEHLRRSYRKTDEDERTIQGSIRGIEKKPLPHMLCMTNMVLHQIDAPTQIRHGNALGRAIADYGKKDLVDVVVTNPPFGGVEEDGVENAFPAAVRTRETADLFLYLIVTLLRPGGRAAIVLPDGSLFGEGGVKTRIKEKLLEECNLHTVVRLPNGVFNPYTGIKTNLLFFTKGEPTRTVWYYGHPYPEGYKNYSKTKPLRIEEFEPEKKWWGKRKENVHAWKVSVEEIKERGYNLDFKNPQAVDDGPGNASDLFEEYKAVTASLADVRERLKNELRQAMSGTR